jgi:Resolvase, N terminal domain
MTAFAAFAVVPSTVATWYGRVRHRRRSAIGPGADTARVEREAGHQEVRVLGYANCDGLQDIHASREFNRQAERIASACSRRGLRLLELVRERQPESENQNPLDRPGLSYALRRILAGEAGGLVVADLSSISHSTGELGRVLEWFSRSNARFIAAASGLDTQLASGRLAVRTVIEVARWGQERPDRQAARGAHERPVHPAGAGLSGAGRKNATTNGHNPSNGNGA